MNRPIKYWTYIAPVGAHDFIISSLLCILFCKDVCLSVQNKNANKRFVCDLKSNCDLSYVQMTVMARVVGLIYTPGLVFFGSTDNFSIGLSRNFHAPV